MSNPRGNRLRVSSFLGIILLAFALAGCSGDDGDDGAAGAPGAPGADGPPGSPGISCWDLNENGVGDPEEDKNGDGIVDVKDCNAPYSGDYEPVQLHQGYFTENVYEGTQSCMSCHGLVGEEMLDNAHFTWQGVSANITGHEGEIHGKRDLLNNFCIAVPTNEGRCSHCHTGYGYADKTFSFDDRNTVDCLICHDQTGTYKKGKKTAGMPDPNVDLNAVARSVAENGGVPTNKNCIFCHAVAGGGDNVKHGDLALSIANTTFEYDVHMGKDGKAKYDCVDCHKVMKNDGKMLDHGIGGMPIHSIDDGEMEDCVDCHGNQSSIHNGLTVQPITDRHTTLACQVCHIPAIARKDPTKIEWLWSEAGDQERHDQDTVDPITGRDTYDKMKGSFKWARNVRPSLLYFDGKWDRMMINTNDQYTEVPVVLAKPSADYTTPGAMIYPFKKMIGNQPADAVNKRILVPHLFGLKGGDNPYWVKYDWHLALQDASDYTGQEYSGEYHFVDTIMYLTVNHEVAPKEQALGFGPNCADCHFEGKVDWQALGWNRDPVDGGTRP